MNERATETAALLADLRDPRFDGPLNGRAATEIERLERLRRIALEDAALLCEARAADGMESGSWDDGISAWDAAQILAAAIRSKAHD